jgi:uncharacterized protein
MLPFCVVSIILLIVFLVFQTKSLVFERHYPLSVIFVWGIALALFLNLILLRGEQASVWRWAGIAINTVLLLVFVALGIAKLILRDNWTQSTRRLLRTPTPLTLPHDKFSVQTSDGVTIRGYHVRRDSGLRDRAVIIAHGGLRSKDIFVNALLSSWLFDRFDVLAFDFRGHGESGGAITGDGKTLNDLKAVIDYAKEREYRKLGVYGRSMGGWAAILETADYHDVDAIVIAGMPPGYFSEVPEISGRFGIGWLRVPGISLLIRILTGGRWKHFENVRRPIDEMDQVSPVPLLIIYNEADPGAGVNSPTPHPESKHGFWANVPLHKRPSRFRHIKDLPFTFQEVYSRAREPKAYRVLEGAGHVYTLSSIKSLFTWIEDWFVEHLS